MLISCGRFLTFICSLPWAEGIDLASNFATPLPFPYLSTLLTLIPIRAFLLRLGQRSEQAVTTAWFDFTR